MVHAVVHNSVSCSHRKSVQICFWKRRAGFFDDSVFFGAAAAFPAAALVLVPAPAAAPVPAPAAAPPVLPAFTVSLKLLPGVKPAVTVAAISIFS